MAWQRSRTGSRGDVIGEPGSGIPGADPLASPGAGDFGRGADRILASIGLILRRAPLDRFRLCRHSLGACGFAEIARRLWPSKGRLTAVFIELSVAIADCQQRPPPPRPSPPVSEESDTDKASSIMVQVDGSGTAVMLNVPLSWAKIVPDNIIVSVIARGIIPGIHITVYVIVFTGCADASVRAM